MLIRRPATLWAQSHFRTGLMVTRCVGVATHLHIISLIRPDRPALGISRCQGLSHSEHIKEPVIMLPVVFIPVIEAVATAVTSIAIQKLLDDSTRR